MSLTNEEKQNYDTIIQHLWKGSVPSSPSQISEDVANIVDTAIAEIYDCPSAFSATLLFLAAIGGAWLCPRTINGLQKWMEIPPIMHA